MERRTNREKATFDDKKWKRKLQESDSASELKPNLKKTSPEKLLHAEEKKDTVNVDTNGYQILQFVSVFPAISALVVCKECKKEVKFNEANSRELGLYIAMTCDCGEVYINSCPLINNAFETNHKLVTLMGLLGIGDKNVSLFGGLKNLVKEIYNETYQSCLNNIHATSAAVLTRFIKRGFFSSFGETKLMNDYKNFMKKKERRKLLY